MQKILLHIKKILPLVAIVSLTGCAQNGAKTAGTDTYKEQTTTTVTVDRATGAESRNTTTQIITPGDERRAEVNIDTDGHDNTILKVESDGDSVRAETEPSTHIRAPLFKLDKNSDSSSVHIKLPFVHIDKDPGGHARVDIGRHH